jgi:hypothetical protein
MTAHRRITRFAATAAAGASILVGLTGCHLPWEDAARTVAHDPAAHQLPAKILEAIAKIPDTLNDLNEVTDGPVRDAVIGTACDAYAQNKTPAWESDTLANLLGDTQPPEEQLLNAVQNLVTTFTYDKQNGLTTVQEIGATCQGYLIKDNLT